MSIAIWIAASFRTAVRNSILVEIGLAVSMSVNVLVTGLIVFRIFKVFRAVRNAAPDERMLDAIGGNKLRVIIFILIESGMALFSIQLIRLILALVRRTEGTSKAYNVIDHIHEMFNVIIRSDIFIFLFC